jgi:hypothetical protein
MICLGKPQTMKLPTPYLSLICFISLSLTVKAGADNLPDQLTDQEFWRIVEDFSEPDGYFRADNLVSNENGFQRVISDLLLCTSPGGVYVGVGPEQNFTYIAALQPKISFVIDIRRGNLHTQLMYKALFELSADRAEFVSLLFTRQRPEGLGPNSTVQDLFNAYWKVKTGEEGVFKENFKRICDLLANRHMFALSKADLAGLEYIYHNFYEFGPGINYASSVSKLAPSSSQNPMYADLMTNTDQKLIARSYLASEENFKIIKGLQHRNLIIPLVGDFAGPKTVRAVGKYVQEHGASVNVFYVSNVESYLNSFRARFCANVATLPLDDLSVFIRSYGNRDAPAVLVKIRSENGCDIKP